MDQKPPSKSNLVKANLSALVVRPMDPQEVRLRPAPVWSRALARS